MLERKRVWSCSGWLASCYGGLGQMGVQLIRTHRTAQTVAPLNGELRPLQLGLFPLGRLGVHLGPADGDAPAFEPTDGSWMICFAAGPRAPVIGKPLWDGALVGRVDSARDGEEEGGLAHAGAAGDHEVPRLHGTDPL